MRIRNFCFLFLLHFKNLTHTSNDKLDVKGESATPAFAGSL